MHICQPKPFSKLQTLDLFEYLVYVLIQAESFFFLNFFTWPFPLQGSPILINITTQLFRPKFKASSLIFFVLICLTSKFPEKCTESTSEICSESGCLSFLSIYWLNHPQRFLDYLSSLTPTSQPAYLASHKPLTLILVLSLPQSPSDNFKAPLWPHYSSD